jgi:hypothetical protein
MALKLKFKTIESFEDLHRFCTPRRSDIHPIFRGVRDAHNHLLVPSLGRFKLRPNASLEKYEARVFKVFKQSALPHLDYVPKSDWEWLAEPPRVSWRPAGLSQAAIATGVASCR